MLPRICIQQSISAGKPTPALWSEIEAAMRDPRIQDICDQIKLLDGQDPDELSRLKRQLPVITPHACRFAGDGTRKSANAVPSGLVMLDIDHVAEPRKYQPTPSPFLKEGEHDSQESALISTETLVAENVYFIAVTPSGHGLRVIGERRESESIPQAQQRLASLLGFTEYDSVTTDLARASFLMPWSYVLYCEPLGLDFDDEQEMNEAIRRESTPQTHEVCRGPRLGDEAKGDETHNITISQEKICSSITDATYHNVPYDLISRELIHLLGGAPEKGERNQIYYTLVRYVRYICDFDAEFCVRILPEFGLSQHERLSTAQSAINSKRATGIPDLLQRAIINAQSLTEQSNIEQLLNNDEQLELPKLPRVLELICRRIPADFRPAMVIAALPILGALATRVRFQYLDKQEHSFSFMSCITAPAATGKSFIRKPVNLLLTPIDLQDDIERKKEEEYKEALRAAKNSKMQPTNPKPCPRNNGINVSIAKLLQLLAYSEGKHLIGIGEEIDTLVKSERAGVWSQKSDIYRLGFDNAKYGQNYMSDTSFSANVPVYYNLLLTGTPGGMYRFFKDVEDGLVTRFCFAQLPDMFGADIPAFENYTPAEEREIIEIATRLDVAEGFIACPHIGNRIRRWLNEKRELAIREDSRAIDTLRKRSAVIGYRAGMLAYLLNGQKYDKAVGEFATWVAEYVFQNQMQLFGCKFEEVAQTAIKVAEKSSQVASLLAQLPQNFTRSELMAVRARNGQSTRVDMVISRWKASGFITQSAKNTYTKTPKATQR